MQINNLFGDTTMNHTRPDLSNVKMGVAEPLAHIKSIEPNCLTTLYIVKQETQVFAKELCIANKDESGEPIFFSIAIKSANDTLENKHFEGCQG